MSDPQPLAGYAKLYTSIATYPELGLFRRFGAYWAKKLHDDTSEVLRCLEDVNREIQDIPQLGEISILDIPLRIVREKCPQDKLGNLLLMWKNYDECLVKYGQTLSMSEHIMNLPQQSACYTKHLGEYQGPGFKAVFDQKKFVPTGEAEKTYRDLSVKADTCAWRDVPRSDFLTTLFISCGYWIEKHILSRLRRCFTTGTSIDQRTQTDVQHGSIVEIMDTLTCLVASALLVATVQVLSWVRPFQVRLGLVGAFGTVFALSVKLMAGSPTRGEVFGATAAFYAVAVVFISSTASDTCRR